MRPIDADNLISILDILSDKGGDIRYWEQLKLIVADCPTYDVQEVQHGRWESVQYGCVCSVCGKRKEQFSDNFCANCGAKMDADENYCTEENCEIFQQDLNCERCNK